MGTDYRQIAAGAASAINLTASLVTIVTAAAGIATIALSLLAQPAIAIGAGVVTLVGGLALATRRVGAAALRARSNARVAPLLRSALVAVADDARELALRDPSRGAPSSDALAGWRPHLAAVDRALRRMDLQQDCLTYLLWLVAEARRSAEALRLRIEDGQPWRDEWLVQRDRLSLLGCILLGEAERRGIRDVTASFAGNPHLEAPTGYGDRTMTAANDVALRGAPAFPSDPAFARCTPAVRGAAPAAPARRTPDDAAPFDSPSAMAAVGAVAVAAGIVASFLVGSWAAFWLIGAFTSTSAAFAWIPVASAVAAAWWALAYAVAALIGDASYSWVPVGELEDAVLHLDLAAATSAPVLSAVVAWWAALAAAAVARWLGGQEDLVAGFTFTVVTLIASVRVVGSQA